MGPPAESPYVVHHHGTEHFALEPTEMWAEMTDVERFEEWWQWLRDLELVRGGIVTGGGMSFAIVSPLPYSLRINAVFVEVVPEKRIAANVTGDLMGDAALELSAGAGGGSDLVLSWNLEPSQRPLRALVRIARPFIMWTKDWVIDIALRSFRDRVERA
ncbi:MAG TPA: hypothetical protein VG408_03190 [Actinomycetota bacterium]|nr:hypothetical protein [Actinomycetota bacterium]